MHFIWSKCALHPNAVAFSQVHAWFISPRCNLAGPSKKKAGCNVGLHPCPPLLARSLWYSYQKSSDMCTVVMHFETSRLLWIGRWWQVWLLVNSKTPVSLIVPASQKPPLSLDARRRSPLALLDSHLGPIGWNMLKLIRNQSGFSRHPSEGSTWVEIFKSNCWGTCLQTHPLLTTLDVEGWSHHNPAKLW